MDFQDIQEAVIEMKEFILRGRIDKVVQLDKYSFLFDLYSFGTSISLLVSVLKRSKRFHLLFDRIHKDYLFSSNATDLFRKYIVGGNISAIYIYEKAIAADILHYRNYRLIVDFHSTNINLFSEAGKLLFALHRRSIQQHGNEQAILKFLKSEKRKTPHFPVNESLSKEFFEEREKTLERKMAQILKNEEKKALRLQDKLIREKEEVTNKDHIKKIGELIKYNLSKLSRGMESATLDDFDGSKITIELNPVMDPIHNMNAYFQKYKKLIRKEALIDEKMDLQNMKVRLISTLKRNIEQGDIALSLGCSPALSFKDFEISSLGKGFKQRLEQLSRAQTGIRVKHFEEKARFLEFISRTDKKIYVGRSAAENEELSLRVARGNDMWFHTESVTGSHVILCYEKKGSFQPEDIMDAAQLALYFSKLRKEKRGNVQYTLCKYLKKPKKSKPGMIIYHNEKTKWIDLDPDILTSLLKPIPSQDNLKSRIFSRLKNR